MNNNADLGDVHGNPNTIEPTVSGNKESDDNGVSTTTNVKLPFHYSSGSHDKGAK